MNLTRIFIALSLIISGLVTFKIWFWPHEEHSNRQWESFSKKGKKTVKNPALSEQIERFRLPASTQDSSFKSPDSNQKIFHHPQYGKRQVTGDKLRDLTAISYINKPSQNWKTLVGDQLLTHQPKGVLVFVRQSASLLQITAGQGHFREEVNVTITHPDGQRGDFKALVDSQTGRILSTWDRSSNHKGIRPTNQASFFPSGEISVESD